MMAERKRRRGHIPTEEEAKRTHGGAGKIIPEPKTPTKRKSKPKAGSQAGVGIEVPLKGGGYKHFKTGPGLRRIRTGKSTIYTGVKKTRKRIVKL
jgi:hypothetical protein